MSTKCPTSAPNLEFWVCLSEKVYETGWGTKSKYQLQDRTKLKLKEFGLDYVKSLMLGVKAKLRKISQEGVFFFTQIVLFD